MAVRCSGCARMVPPETGVCPRCGTALRVPLRLAWLARLFWACPACGAELSLTVHQPLFGAPSLGCRACGATWTLDADGRTLARIDPATKATIAAGPVEEWLIHLPPPLAWRPLPAPRLLLSPGETCLVRVEGARMLAPRQSVRGQQPVGRVEVLPGVYERVGADPLGPSPAALATLARGPFFVTDRRAVFLGDRKHVEIPLARLDAAEVDEGYLLLHRAARTDTFGFDGESAIKVRAAILAIVDGAREPGRAAHVMPPEPPGDAERG